MNWHAEERWRRYSEVDALQRFFPRIHYLISKWDKMNFHTFFLFCFLFLFITGPAHAQTQMGDDIDGEHTGDASGYSIALSSDGLRLAIGASGNDDNGRETGHVRVYEWSGMEWTQVGSDIDGIQEFENAGRGVSMSPDGSRIAVGAYMNDDAGFDGGQVRLYEWDGTTWRKMGENINARTFNQWMGLGESISMSDNSVAVGVPGAHYEGRGYVQIYEWNDVEWIQQGQDIEGEARGDGFGASVSLSRDGNKVAIGAPNNDDNGAYSGHVRIYEWSGSEWYQLGLDIDGEKVSSGSGRSVAISADGLRVAIGGPYYDGNGFNSGYVRIYEWTGLEWRQVGSNIDGKVTKSKMGTSVSLSATGDTVAIGRDGTSLGRAYAGAVVVYRWNGSEWLQLGKEMSGESNNNFFGISVAMSYDGKVVAGGAYQNDGNGRAAGHVRVFDLSEIVTATEEQINEIQVYPNPTSGKIRITGGQFESVTILDSFGKCVFEDTELRSDIDLSPLSPGVYYLRINTERDRCCQKIIKL